MLRRGHSTGQLKGSLSPINSTSEAAVTENSPERKPRAHSEVVVCTNDDLSEETSAVMNSFLEEALGSDMDSYDEDSKSFLDPEVVSLANEICDTKPASENLHYTVSKYRALTQSRQSRIRRPLPSSLFFIPDKRHSDDESKKEKTGQEMLQDLQKEMNAQKTILYQVTKALIVCRSSKELQASCERVESERLLLHACQKFNAVKTLVNQMELQGRINNNGLFMESGRVDVSDLILNVSPSCHALKGGGQAVWLVCVLSHQATVFITQAVQLANEAVVFPGTFSFTNLLNDFVISIDVYSLALKNPQVPETHYFRKMLKKPRLKTCSFQNSEQSSVLLTKANIFETSDFCLQGTFKVSLPDLRPSLSLKETSCGQLGMRLHWSVEPQVHLSGFLTIREDSRGRFGAWDRRWCLLEGCSLKYWNYPSEKDSKPPVRELDLVVCKNARVQPLDRTQSFRPLTFLLEMENPPGELAGQGQADAAANPPVIQYLLSTDTPEELSHWCTMLTENLCLLRTWNTRLCYSPK